MGLVRTTITIPDEVLALVDKVAGPRGRSAYIADVVARQVRRDHGRRVFAELAGALKGSKTWGESDEEVLANLRALRDSSERDHMLYDDWEGEGEVPAGHDAPARPRPRSARRPRTRDAVVQRAE